MNSIVMRPDCRAGLAVLLSGALVSALAGPAAPQAGSISWSPSYSAAQAAAARGNRLVMVDFYTDWCTYCKKLDRETYTDKAVIRELQNFVSVKVNAEKEGRALATRFAVSGFPTILFLTAAGAEVTRIPGFIPARELTGVLRRLQADQKRLPLLAARLQQQPGDVAAMVELAKLRSRRNEPDSMAGLVRRIGSARPGHPELLSLRLALGGAYLRAARGREALGVFQEALPLARKPEHRAEVRMGMAASYLQYGNLKEGLRLLESLASSRETPAAMKERAKSVLPRLRKEVAAQGKAKPAKR